MTIGVPVSDQDRAVDFYLEKLRLEKRRDVPFGQFAGRWIEVGPPGATITIALVPAREERPAGMETGIPLTHGRRRRAPRRAVEPRRRRRCGSALARRAADVRVP